MQVTAIAGFAIYYVPLVAAIVVPWVSIAVLLTLFYRPAPLAIKRIEAPLSSQVLSCISELLSGAQTLRLSPLAERQLTKELYASINSLNRVHFTSFACHGWMSIQSHFASCVIYFAIGLLALRLRYSVIPGVLVVLLTSCFDVLRTVGEIIDDIAEFQRGLNCVERLDHYAKDLSAERQDDIRRNVNIVWPSKGEIEMHSLSMRYRPNLPLVLHNVNLCIRGGERIGIVGRTGAGKSSIFYALLGFTDPCEGSITIDGVDITLISVRHLRQALAVIPQDPLLFEGTVRSNLDPRRERTDEELELALRRTGLSQTPSQHPETDEHDLPNSTKHHLLHLSTPISSGGQNLSSGQRQLLSLARALIRNTRIILVDEATASIDYESDVQVQRMLRTEFGDRTVLVIAHRIQTVKDYDRIAVFDQGKLVQFGAPQELWDCEGGMFRELCAKSGLERTEFAG